MFSEELEAHQSLCFISQKTSYIVDWTEKPTKKRLQPFHKPIISQEKHEEIFRRPVQKKIMETVREASEKYNLKKYQNNLQTINQIEFPLVDHSAARADEFLAISKKSSSQPNTPSPNFRQKESVQSNPCRVIDVEFLNKKLTIFQRKHSESQKNINTKNQNPHFRQISKNLLVKRNPIIQEERDRKLLINSKELQQIKKMLAKNSTLNSQPRFHKVQKLQQLRL